MQPRDPKEFQVGDRVPGTKWVVRGKLGCGGMGLVLDVVKEPGIRGAMKVLLPSFAKRSEFVDRFFDEVKLLAQLRHPNIVQVFDYDRLDDGTPYVVMERLIGVTLRAGLRKLRAKKTPISAKLTYEVTRQLCEGLFRAHSNVPVIVHRDVKPENIFFHQPDFADAVVKVLDFGIAAVLDRAHDRRVLGTPRHMAPEQIRGEPVSPATDVYAAGLVLYELLTGRFPWDVDLRDEMALVDAHVHRAPAPPSKFTPWVPKGVDQWVLRALSKDPKERPQDAYKFISKLYELQYVNDGTSDSVVDINTTAPTLGSLAEVVEDAAAPTRVNDSARTRSEMSEPPIEGASLEVAGGAFAAGMTDPMTPPKFSPQTMERAAIATTQVPSGVDRAAPTRTAIPDTRPVPKTDTFELLSPTPIPNPVPRSRPLEPPTTAAATPMASTAPLVANGNQCQRSLVRGRNLLAAAVGLALLAAFALTLLSARDRMSPLETAATRARIETAKTTVATAERAAVPVPVDTVPTAATTTREQIAVVRVPGPTATADIPRATVTPPRRVLHAPAKASATVPDDGRELLYDKP